MDGNCTNERKKQLIGQLYALLCMFEERRDWESLLQELLLNLADFEGKNSIRRNILVSKLAACQFLSYKYFRKNIFECINLINQMSNNELF